jgi:hypothetical protein
LSRQKKPVSLLAVQAQAVAQADLLVAKVLATLQIVKVKVKAKAKLSNKITLLNQVALSSAVQVNLHQVLNLAAQASLHQVRNAHLLK